VKTEQGNVKMIGIE